MLGLTVLVGPNSYMRFAHQTISTSKNPLPLPVN